MKFYQAHNEKFSTSSASPLDDDANGFGLSLSGNCNLPAKYLEIFEKQCRDNIRLLSHADISFAALKSISSSQGFKASPPGGAAFETLHQPTKGAYNTEKQLGFGSREPCILKISYLGNVCNITKHLYK